MWKNFVEPCRPQMTMWRMRNACSIIKSTHTHTHTHTHTLRICNTYCFPTATMVARTCRNATLNACLVGFDPRPAHVGFVVKKVSEVAEYSPCTLVFLCRCHSTYHQRPTICISRLTRTIHYLLG